MFQNEPSQDLIPVRPDEGIDTAKVAAFLQGKLPGSDQPLTIRQFGGGAANLTYQLDYGSHEYVLRRPPLGPVAKSAHDMAREYKVLAVLHERFMYAPRAFLYHPDPDLIGSDFFIMERRHGLVVRRQLPVEYSTFAAATRQMSSALVDGLADLHRVDYQSLGLGDLGRPVGFVTRQIEGWYRRWQKAKETELPEMDFLYEWLLANEPTAARQSLVHNDYKLDNVMFAATDPSQMVAIFDWDMCTLGDPLCDLGSLLAYWTEPDDPPHFQAIAAMPLGDLGFMSRAELVDRYAQRSGQSVDEINFYYALALYRLVVIIAQIHIRFVRGQTRDQRFAALGQVIPLIARAAQDVAEGAVRV